MNVPYAAAFVLVGWSLMIPQYSARWGSILAHSTTSVHLRTSGISGRRSTPKASARRRKNICGLRHPSASNSHVSILIAIRTAISSQYQKRGSLRNALRLMALASRNTRKPLFLTDL